MSAIDEPIDALGRKLRISIRQHELFQQALTHPSFGGENYQRLEFLGDAVLDLVVGELLYKQYPQASEGQLSQMRANLVNKDSLGDLALSLELDKMLIFGAGEQLSGKHSKILADVLEAIVAAIYLQDGLEISAQVIERVFADKLQQAVTGLQKNAKTELQEWLQARGHSLPKYQIINTTGSAHKLEFQVSCTIADLQIQTQAQASSRRSAETMAAEQALEQLRH